jgi:hypothetical protein
VRRVKAAQFLKRFEKEVGEIDAVLCAVYMNKNTEYKVRGKTQEIWGY